MPTINMTLKNGNIGVVSEYFHPRVHHVPQASLNKETTKPVDKYRPLYTLMKKLTFQFNHLEYGDVSNPSPTDAPDSIFIGSYFSNILIMLE